MNNIKDQWDRPTTEDELNARISRKAIISAVFWIATISLPIIGAVLIRSFSSSNHLLWLSIVMEVVGGLMLVSGLPLLAVALELVPSFRRSFRELNLESDKVEIDRISFLAKRNTNIYDYVKACEDSEIKLCGFDLDVVEKMAKKDDLTQVLPASKELKGNPVPRITSVDGNCVENKIGWRIKNKDEHLSVKVNSEVASSTYEPDVFKSLID